MGGMSQHEGDDRDPDDPEEEFSLLQPGTGPTEYEPEVYPKYGAEPEEKLPTARKPFQFTLGELFWLMTGLALVLGIGGSIPGEYSVELLAGLAGLGLLVSLVVLAVVQPTRPIVRLAWWVFLGFYVVVSLVAVVRSLW